MGIFGIGRSGSTTKAREPYWAVQVRSSADELRALDQEVRPLLDNPDREAAGFLRESLGYQERMMFMVDTLMAPLTGGPADAAREIAAEEWIAWADDQRATLREVVELSAPVETVIGEVVDASGDPAARQPELAH